MKFTWTVLACLVLSAPFAWSQPVIQQKITIDLAEAYVAADTNRDKCLTLDEASLYVHKKYPLIVTDAQIQQLYKENDKNSDGCISREEAGLPADPGTTNPTNGNGCGGCTGNSAAKSDALTLLFGLLGLALMARTGRV